MTKNYALAFTCLLGLYCHTARSQSNAAPSEHLTYYFPSNGVLEMHKVEIVQSAFASYFETNSFTNGYAGLQQTPDSSHGSSHILISSLWDPNTSAGIYSVLDYAAPNTYTGRFGGEGDGWQSINPYNWKLNTWYNVVIRSWTSNGQLFVATFIYNGNAWFQTATFSIPDPGTYLGSANDAFLENWDGSTAAWDGRYIRKAYFKDCWMLTSSGSWEKSNSRNFSANADDSARNGIYNNAFNAGYDSTQNAYFMQNGGSTTPSSAFNGGRTLSLPAQTNQGTAPTLTTGSVTAVSASYSSGHVYVNWTIDSSKSPQLAATVKVLNSSGSTLLSYTDTVPQRRSDTLATTLSGGTYTVQVSFTDLFNQTSNTGTTNLTVSGGTKTYWYLLKNVSSGKYLSVKGGSTANLANIVQSATTTSVSEWELKSSGGATVLINRNSSKAIDLPGSNQNLGTDPIQYTESDNPNQQWNLVSVGSGNYLIQSNMSNHYVLDDSASSTTEGSNIILYSSNGSTGSANQQWGLFVADSTISSANPAALAETTPSAFDADRPAFKIFPNPVHQTLHVSFESTATGGTTIEIISMSGTVVYRSVQAGNMADIDVSSLSAGMYMIRVNGRSGKFIRE